MVPRILLLLCCLFKLLSTMQLQFCISFKGCITKLCCQEKYYMYFRICIIEVTIEIFDKKTLYFWASIILVRSFILCQKSRFLKSTMKSPLTFWVALNWKIFCKILYYVPSINIYDKYKHTNIIYVHIQRRLTLITTYFLHTCQLMQNTDTDTDYSLLRFWLRLVVNYAERN